MSAEVGDGPARIVLRPVEAADLPIFFEHQRDPEATAMAGFPARDRETFAAHWTRILADEKVTTRTIVFDGEVAGNVVAFPCEGKIEVGYWIGRPYWGKGIATEALAAFLEHVTVRPLHAGVVKHNAGSVRVLEKCGFVRAGEEGDHLVFELQAV